MTTKAANVLCSKIALLADVDLIGEALPVEPEPEPKPKKRPIDTNPRYPTFKISPKRACFYVAIPEEEEPFWT
jgi:hypothetical protein